MCLLDSLSSSRVSSRVSLQLLAKFGMVIHGPQKMILNDYGDPLKRCRAPPPGQIFHWTTPLVCDKVS